MKKRLLLGIFLGIMLVGLVSAQYGYYGSFSISNFLDSIGPSTMILFVLFIIFFAILHNIIFMNFFKGNKSVSVIVSFCVSLLAVYGINRARWDLSGLFYGFGISESALFTLISIILLVIVIYAIFTKKLKYLFLIFGGLLLGLALFTELIYERGIAIVIGIVLLIIGGLLLRGKRRRAPYDHGGYPGSVRRGRYPREGPGFLQRAKDWRDPGVRLEKYGAKRGRLQQKEAAQLEKYEYKDERTRSGALRRSRAIGRQRLKGYQLKPSRLKGIYKAERYKGRKEELRSKLEAKEEKRLRKVAKWLKRQKKVQPEREEI